MPSKGVQYYSYVGERQFDVTVQKPANWGNQTSSILLSSPGVMQTGNLQISEEDIGLLEHTGCYEWTARQNHDKRMHQYAKISPFTGNLGESSMGVMLNTPSVVEPGYAISYGFYDAGTGWGPLTSQDQSYVYVTRNHSRWMGDLVDSTPAIAQKPFGTLVLPGAHDSGMFDPTTLQKVAHDPGVRLLLASFLGIGAGMLTASMALRGAINLSFTQKDDIATMLNLGVRYLDFRPGYCYKDLIPGLYHQHSFIPGYPFDRFLTDVFAWLQAHPTEIVVVSLGYSGFADGAMRPSFTAVRDEITAAQLRAGAGGILHGNKDDLATPLATLLQHNKRIIFLNRLKELDHASACDSYTDEAYQTTQVSSILEALRSITPAKQAGHDYTILQLQGTATAAGGGTGLGAVLSMSDASSPLLSTKAAFDQATYPWVKDNVNRNLLPTQLVVLLNDFADNALTEYAIGLTRARAGV